MTSLYTTRRPPFANNRFRYAEPARAAPLVVLTPTVWERLIAQAVGSTREGGGLLLGTRVGGTSFCVLDELALEHQRADAWSIKYGANDFKRARWAAAKVYGPELEPVGMWHTHPWDGCGDAIGWQMSMDGEGSDLDEARDGDIEVICAVFPDRCNPVADELHIQRRIGSTWCRAEANLRAGGEAVRCEVEVATAGGVAGGSILGVDA